jgi:tetratricopeptide (TPR) repeat protein
MVLGSSSTWAQANLRPEVQKPLLAAQEAFSKKQFEQAFKFANDAWAVPQLTPQERAMVLRSRAAAANALQNWDVTIESLEEVVGSANLDAKDRWVMLESLVGASQKKKDWPRVLKWVRAYVSADGPKPVMRSILIQTLSMQSEHRQVIEEMHKKLALDAQTQTKTGEQDLRLMAIAYKQLKDDAGYFEAIKRLLALYPSKAYWEDAIGLLANQPGFNARLELDLYRLLEETNNLEEPDIYIEMVNQALKLGLPAEAHRVLTKGFVAGVLGKGGQEALHQKLRLDVQKKLQEDESALPQLERSAKDGNDWSAIGEVYLSRQKWMQAHEAFAKAQSIGQVRREQELRLHHAIALFKIGQIDAARQQLAQIQSDPSAQGLAGLWMLRMN